MYVENVWASEVLLICGESQLVHARLDHLVKHKIATPVLPLGTACRIHLHVIYETIFD